MQPAAYRRMALDETRHWWYLGRRAVLAKLLARLALQRSTARILEVGCGSGGNLSLLAQFGTVEAVEPDSATRSLASRRSGLAVRPGTLPNDIDVPNEGFDLIALFDVLEHVEDDAGALATLRSKLAFGGRIMCTVPAYPWLWSAHDDLHHHHRRYTKRTLVKALSAAGLVPEHVGHFNTFLLPIAVAHRLSTRRLAPARAADAGVPRWLDRLLYRLFAAERHWITRVPMPAGLSLFTIARVADR